MKPTWTSACGRAVLYNADCREALASMPDEAVEMIWTDPPYGHGNADGDWLSRRASIMADGNDSPQVAIANDGGDEMRAVVDAMLLQAARVLRCCCCCCCCCGGGPRPTFAWLAERMDRGGMQFFHSVIWDKRNPGIGWRYRRQHEMVMVAHRRGGKLAWPDDTIKQPNIVSLPKPKNEEHSNAKPVELVKMFLRCHTREGDTVLDPFMGGGATGVAAIEMGRRFVGMELEPRYFKVAQRRIQQAIEDYALFQQPPEPAKQAEMFTPANP